MKKTIITAAAAIAISGAAYAGDLTSTAGADTMAPEDVIASKIAQEPSGLLAKLGTENGKFDGMGGPEWDDENAMTSGYAPGTRSITMSQPAASFQPIHRGSYPACSANVTDNCQQR